MAVPSLATGISQDFAAHYSTYWANLARLNNLLIVLNVSLFFVSELVTEGYYYTYFSLLLTAVVYVGLVIPMGRTGRVGHYSLFVICEVGAIYFVVASVWYWIQTNKMGG